MCRRLGVDVRVTEHSPHFHTLPTAAMPFFSSFTALTLLVSLFDP